MSAVPAKPNNQAFLKLLNNAKASSGRTNAQIGQKAHVSRSYVGLIFSGDRHPPRDQVIVICVAACDLDLYDTDLILKAGGYKTLFDWNKTGWSQQESTSDDE